MDVLLAFIGGAILGWIWHAKIFFQQVATDPDHMIRLLTELKRGATRVTQDSKAVIWIEVEWINGRCYLWERDSHDFIGQGDTVESAVEHSHCLRPGTEYRIVPEQAKKPS